MIHASVTYAMAFDIRGEYALVVNPFMQPVSKKFGFQLFRELVLKDLRDPDGNPLITDNEVQSILIGGYKFY